MSFTLDEATDFKTRGLNKQHLLQTASIEVAEIYQEVFQQIEGSLSQNVDNDIATKFNITMATLNITTEQIGTLDRFQTAFTNIESKIDPDRLQFEIMATDDEDICIFRRSPNGLTNIIISDDGSFSFSFIASSGSPKSDKFQHFEPGAEFDSEALAYTFLYL